MNSESEYEYPTDEQLEQVATFRGTGKEWLALVKSLWWAPDWGWHEFDGSEDGKPIRVYQNLDRRMVRERIAPRCHGAQLDPVGARLPTAPARRALPVLDRSRNRLSGPGAEKALTAGQRGRNLDATLGKVLETCYDAMG